MRFRWYAVVFCSLLAFVLAPGLHGVAHAVPCAVAGAPMCDGDCPPTEQCVDVAFPGPPGGVSCECVPSAGDPCGVVAGPPLCYGECPPGESCFDKGFPIGCMCDVVPTLSEWGIIGMSCLMFAGVFYLRRRGESVRG